MEQPGRSYSNPRGGHPSTDPGRGRRPGAI